MVLFTIGFPGAVMVKNTCQSRKCRKRRFSPWVRQILWRRKWQPTPGFLSKESYGQRSLVCYSHGVTIELDTTEQLNNNNKPYILIA